MQANETIIFKAAHEGWSSSLAFFFIAKGLFRNSTIFNYSTRSLASKIGCSHQKVARHIKKLSKVGLIRRTGNNITFIKVAENHKCKLNIYKKDTLKQVEYKLKLKLITLKLKQSMFIIAAKREAKILEQPNYIPIKRLKKIQRQKRKYSLESAINNDLTYSDKRLADVLGVCSKTYNKIKRWLKSQGFIDYVIERVKLDFWNKKSFFELENKQWLFKGCYFRSRTVYRPLI